MLLRSRLALRGASLVLAAAALSAQQPADEPPPTVGASTVLSATQLKGAHHSVEEAVSTPGFFHEFTVTSEFGTFRALGRLELDRVIREVNGLHELAQVSKSDIFIEAAGQSLINVGKGAANAVTKPVDTAKGVGSGLKRMGTNLGRRSKRAVDEVGDEDPELSEEEKAATGSGAINAAYGVLQVRRPAAAHGRPGRDGRQPGLDHRPRVAPQDERGASEGTRRECRGGQGVLPQ